MMFMWQEFRAILWDIERSLSHLWCSWDENSEVCGTSTHLIWDAILWLSVTHCPYFKNRMWENPSKTIFYFFISGIWVKIWLRPNGTADCGPWGRHESSIVFITPAPRINFFIVYFIFQWIEHCFLQLLKVFLLQLCPMTQGWDIKLLARSRSGELSFCLDFLSRWPGGGEEAQTS